MMIAQARKRLLDAWLSERGWANRMHASCRSLLGGLARAPKGPRLVLVDSLGIGPRSRERMQLAGPSSSASSRRPSRWRRSRCATRSSPRAWSSTGVRQIVFNRLLERRHRELADLSDEVLDWIESYRMPPGAACAR